MLINEDDILNPDYYDENKALACLLADDICFLNNCEFEGESTTCVFVLINDVFYPAADSECITSSDGDENSEIISLYIHHRADPAYGVVKWVAKKRNLQPGKRTVNSMKNIGAWDDEMEALNKNTCW